jgi:hypothetical protein
MIFFTRLLTLWFVYFTKKKREAVLATNQFITRSHFFTLILPEEEKDFLASLKIIDHLLQQKKDVTIVLNNAKAHYIHQKYSIREIEFYQTDKNKFGLPTKKFTEQLSKLRSDVVMDLSRGDSYFHIAAAYSINTKFVIGFEKMDSDKFYSIQLRINESTPEISYKNFLNCIQMF